MPANYTFGSAPASSMTAFGGSTEGDIWKQFYPKYPAKPDALSAAPTTTPNVPGIQPVDETGYPRITDSTPAVTPPTVPKSAAEEYGWTFQSQPLGFGTINTGSTIATMGYNPATTAFLKSSGISGSMDQRQLAKQAIEAYNESLKEYLATPEIAPQATAYREQYGANPELYKQAERWMAIQKQALGDRWNPTLPSFGTALEESYRNRLLAPYLQT